MLTTDTLAPVLNQLNVGDLATAGGFILAAIIPVWVGYSLGLRVAKKAMGAIRAAFK